MTEVTRETCANCHRDRYKGTGGWLYQADQSIDGYVADVPECGPQVVHDWEPAEQGKASRGRTLCHIPNCPTCIALGYEPVPLDAEPERDVCVWEKDDDGESLTDCGAVHVFGGGHPFFKFCPYCGKALEAV